MMILHDVINIVLLVEGKPLVQESLTVKKCSRDDTLMFLYVKIFFTMLFILLIIRMIGLNMF